MRKRPALVAIALAAMLAAASADVGLPLQLNLGQGPNDRTGASVRDLFGSVQQAINQLSSRLQQTADDLSARIAQISGAITNQTAPAYSAALLGNVTADNGVDQAANITAAIAAMPADGGDLVLPCGNITVGGTLVLNRDRVRLRSANQYCSHIVTTFLAGDVVLVTGNYSGVSDLAFEHYQTPAQNLAGILPYRTSGFTVNLANGYGFVENVSMRHCWVCIRMGTRGGWSRVRHAMIQYVADGLAADGSGGILIDNFGIGPENWIEDVIMTPNIGAPPVYLPGYGIKLVNTGATHIQGVDVTQLRAGLVIAPGNGQTVQATLVSDSYFDGASADNVVIRPTGSGYVFHTSFVNNWITNIPNAGGVPTNGLVIDASQASGAGRPSAIMKTSWSGGTIASTTGQNGTGVLIADPAPIDTSITDTTIFGWNFGINVAPNANHVAITGNRIGAYGFFDIPGGGDASNRTNRVGLNVSSGAGDYIRIANNTCFLNSVSPLGFAATGVHNLVSGNIGCAPVGASQVAVGASPFVLPPLPYPRSFNIVNGAGIQVTTPDVAGTGTILLCNTSPCSFELPPGRPATLQYTSGPALAQMLR